MPREADIPLVVTYRNCILYCFSNVDVKMQYNIALVWNVWDTCTCNESHFIWFCFKIKTQKSTESSFGCCQVDLQGDLLIMFDVVVFCLMPVCS